MKYFEKYSKKEDETGIYPRRFLHAIPVPFLRGYLATDPEIAQKHPAVAAFLGPGGAYGAKAKDTGKSYLKQYEKMGLE